jgi:D-galactarolactone cycloisomerase
VTLANFEGRFHKFVAMNSYDKAPKGHTYPQTLVRIATDQGIEGVGVMGYAAATAEFHRSLKSLIGAHPLELYEMKEGRIAGRSPEFAELLSSYRFLDGALLDLIGKLTGKPVWQLIGKSARERVEVYDGTLYFSDVWFRDRGLRAVVEEAEEAQRKGYRGIKLKLGRGWKWMGKEDGLRRDIEVVRAVRKAIGPQMKLMGDANNGYQKDPERAWRLLAETADANLYMIEEIFPEDVQQYTDLRAKMHQAGLKTLIADGENASNIALFRPYLEPRRLMDILQMDIRTGGLLDNLTLARMAETAGAVSIPHNWGSQIGGLMGLHLAKAVPNAIAAEDDRSTCDLIIAEGYEFQEGTYSVPEKPGLSIRVDEDVYKLKCKPSEIVIN